MCFLGKLVKIIFWGQLFTVAKLQNVLLIDLEEKHNYMFSVTSCGAAC